MSVMISLMYAAAAVALLAIVLECCCRRQLRRMRDAGPHIVALNGVNMNHVPYPVETYPSTPPVVGPGGTVVYPMPVPAADVGPCNDEFFRSYPTPAPINSTTTTTGIQNIAETPPPSYDQVMANERKKAPHPVVQRTRPDRAIGPRDAGGG